MSKELDFVEFWAQKFKENPQKYRKILYKFVNSQIFMAQARLQKLDPQKIIEIFDIKNENIINQLYLKFKKKSR